MAKIGDWVEGADVRVRRGSAGGSGRPLHGPADFTSTTDSPDKRRLQGERRSLQHQQSQSKRRTLEEQWRQECLAAATARDLTDVQESRIVYYDPAVVHRDGCAALVVVGGHYRTGIIDREDLLLHCVQELDKIGNRPFVVLYFNASAPLSLLPDTVFFTELHAALDPRHRHLLHAGYVVHPGARFRVWASVLRLQDPAVYGKLVYVDRVADLVHYFHPDIVREIPDLVRDKDARVAGSR